MKVHSSIPLPSPQATSQVIAHYFDASEAEGKRSLRRLSGAEFVSLVATQVNRLASLIGTRRSHFSCILASSDPVEVAVTALATWRLGGHVILPPNLRPATLSRLIKQETIGDSRVVIPELALQLSGTTVKRPETAKRDAQDDASSSPTLLTEVDSSDRLLTCYTSGTTGEPTAAHKTAGQILGEARLLASLYMTTPGRGVVCSVPAHHLYGFLFGVLAPLYGEQVLVGGSGPERPSLRSLSVALFEPQLVSVPVHLRSLLSTERKLLAAYYCTFSSSAPLPEDVGQELLSLSAHARLVEMFGSSETGGIAARENRPGGVWQPLPGVRVGVSEEQLLTLNSPFTDQGSETTTTTSDQIEILPDGFRHLGRRDGVVKIGGKRVSLQDLEARVSEQAEIKDVACVVLPTTGLRQQEIAMVLVAREKPPSEPLFKQEVRNRLREHFDDVVIPRRIRLAHDLPRSATGKIERSSLAALFESPPTAITRGNLLQGFADFRIISEASSLDAHDPHLEYEVRLSADQIWFRGHFPDFAVLPGVVQLHSLVLECARHYWPQFEDLRSQRQIKFKRPLIPGDTLRVRLCPAQNPKRLSFHIEWLGNLSSSERGPVLAASGVLYFDA